jgi:hypothetical protein
MMMVMILTNDAFYSTGLHVYLNPNSITGILQSSADLGRPRQTLERERERERERELKERERERERERES